MKNLSSVLILALISAGCMPKKDPLNRYPVPLPKEVVEKCIEENPNISPTYCQLDLCLTSPLILRSAVYLLEQVSQVFKDVGLEDRWWLDCGTIIGAVRYQNILGWDDDVDLGMLREDFMPKFSRMQELLKAKGLELEPVYQQPAIMGMINREGLYQVSLGQAEFFRQVAEWDEAEIVRGRAKLTGADYKNLWESYNRRGRLVPSLDIILSDRFDKGIGYMSSVFRGQCGYFEETDFIPTQKHFRFLDKDYPMPANYQKYLKQCYKTDDIKNDVVIFSDHRSECSQRVRLRDVRKVSGFTDYMVGYLKYIFPKWLGPTS